MKPQFSTKIYSAFSSVTLFHVVLALVILGLATYNNAIHNPFVHDDVVFIQHNRHIDSLNLMEIFNQKAFSNGEGSLVNTYYRPLLELFNRLINKVAHRTASVFHFVNIVVHILNSILAFFIFKHVARCGNALGLFGAIVFMIHPVQSEAVACISGISNLLCAFFMMASILFYWSAFSKQEGIKAREYLLSLIAFVLGLLTKEQAAVIPVILICYEYFQRDNISPRIMIRNVGAFFILLLLYFVLRKTLFGSVVTPSFDSLGELSLRVKTIPRTLLMYLSLIFLPHDLHYYRSINFLDSNVPGTAGFMIVLVAAYAALKKAVISRSVYMFGLCWFLISLLPVLNIVPLVNEYSLILTAEHFLYFPLLGLIIVFIKAYDQIGKKEAFSKVRKYLSVGLAFLVVLMSCGTIYQNRFWRSEIELFKRTLKYEENFGRVRILLGTAYYNDGKYELALKEFSKALKIMEGYLSKVSQIAQVQQFYIDFIIQCNDRIARSYQALGNFEAASIYIKKALVYLPDNAWMHYSLAMNYVKLNDIPLAINEFERAVELNKNYNMAINGLAICYKEMGRLDKAEQLYRTIIKNDPQSDSAKQNLEQLLLLKQKQF